MGYFKYVFSKDPVSYIENCKIVEVWYNLKDFQSVLCGEGIMPALDLDF